MQPSEAVVQKAMREYFPEDVLRDLEVSKLLELDQFEVDKALARVAAESRA